MRSRARWNQAWRQGWSRLRREDGERGAVSLFVLIVATVIFATAGLVYDGARLVSASREASWQAAEAARAGAQMVDAGAVAGGPIVLDRPRATSAANSYLSQAGASGQVTSIDDVTITVSVTATWYPTFTGVFAPGGRQVSGTGTASVHRP